MLSHNKKKNTAIPLTNADCLTLAVKKGNEPAVTESEAEGEGEKGFFTGVRPDRKLFLSRFNRTKNREILIVALAKKSLRCRPRTPPPLLCTPFTPICLSSSLLCVCVHIFPSPR